MKRVLFLALIWGKMKTESEVQRWSFNQFVAESLWSHLGAKWSQPQVCSHTCVFGTVLHIPPSYRPDVKKQLPREFLTLLSPGRHEIPGVMTQDWALRTVRVRTAKQGTKLPCAKKAERHEGRMLSSKTIIIIIYIYQAIYYSIFRNLWKRFCY